MNIIDIVILVILGVSVVYGLYKGFVHSLLSMACGLAALLLAFTFAPKLSAYLSNSAGVSSTLATYTDAVARVGDWDLASAPVEQLSDDTISQVLANVDLPDTIENVLEQNLLNHTFVSTGLETVNDYVSNTIVGVAVSVLCFIVCYAVAYLLLSLIINLIHHVFKLPLLKQLDWLAGGVFGLLRGALILYVIFLALPLVSTIINVEALDALIADSTLATIFQSDGLFARVISGNM
ncbi:MAG: CvpA family protein [Clostridia bacterium]|nr:CvpA family protein [Clostridia bacterium]